jgi:DNA recombination protein RmuC
MLRTAQYAWQQEALSENAKTVFDIGREVYERLSGLGKHVDGLGKALTNAVTAYNRTVGSLESRVLVSARKLNELGLTDAELDPPKPVEETVRELSAPDLIIDSGPELVSRTRGDRDAVVAPHLISGRSISAAG